MSQPDSLEPPTPQSGRTGLVPTGSLTQIDWAAARHMRNARRWLWRVGVPLLLTVYSAGCASTGPNVKAIRHYKREKVSVALMHQHIRQLGDTLALLNVLINQTPYTPGDTWVQELPLTAERKGAAEALDPDPECADLVVCVYSNHVRSVLSRSPAAPPTPTAPTAGRQYQSIAEALGSLHPNLDKSHSALRKLQTQLHHANSTLKALQAAPRSDPSALERHRARTAELAKEYSELHAKLNRPLSESDLQSPESSAIARDALRVTSVALRLATEAAALGTVVALEAVELGSGRQKLVADISDTTKLAANLPGDSRRIFQELQQQVDTLSKLVNTLSSLQHVDPTDTAGYELKESLVDEIAGFGWDSIHLDLQGGGNALYYSALSETGSSSGFDFTGRFTELEYDVEPIVLAAADLSLKVDLPHWAEAFGLKLAYETNRVYQSGGNVEEGSLAGELGSDSRLSDILDGTLGIAHVESRVKIANFTQGEVRTRLVEDGTELASAPLNFQMKQVDVRYNLMPPHAKNIHRASFGFRYFDYSLPRVLYELVNVAPAGDAADYVFNRETPPQAIRTQYYMLAMVFGAQQRVGSWVPYLDLDLAAGYGPTRYYFLRDDDAANDADNREYEQTNSIGLQVAATLGTRWELARPRSRFSAYFDVRYRAQFIGGLLNSDDDRVVDVGTTDVFHGPNLAVGATF